MNRITRAEWQVMSILWQESPLSVAGVMARLPGRSWSASTVRTFLARLEKKGLVRVEKNGKIRTFLPALPREETRRIECSAFLERVFDGDAFELISHYLTNEKLKKSALSELQALVKKMKKDR